MNNRHAARIPKMTLTVPEEGTRVMSRDNRHQPTAVPQAPTPAHPGQALSVVGGLAGISTSHLRRFARGRVVSGAAVVMPLRYPVTDAGTLSAHLVSEDALIAGRRAGRFWAVCGEIVLAASLTAQERAHCRSCVRLRRRAER